MSDNIINLDDHRPHQTSYVACFECGKDWVAVAPVDTVHFQCPNCIKLSAMVVEPYSADFINAFMRPSKSKADRHRRTMVMMNADRMIKAGLI